MFVVIIGFVIFSGEGVEQILENIGGLFGIGVDKLTNAESMYYLVNYASIFVISILASTPILKNIVKKLKGKIPRIINIFEPLVLSLLLIICVSYLVDGSFSPFLYFRF